MFPYEIYLKVCKRLKTEEDRQLLDQIKQDIFDESIPIKTIIYK